MKISTWKNTRAVMDKTDTYSLRGICMIMIIIHHVYKVFVSNHGYPSTMMDRYWGDLGTGVFFFISGYGLFCSLSVNNHISIKYVGKVLRKLLIPFVVAFVISILSTIIVCPEELDSILWRNFFTLTIPNTSTWFFKVICVYYFICLLLFSFVQNSKMIVLIVAGCTLVYFLLGKYVFHFSPYLFCTTINFPLGMTYATYRKGIRFDEKNFGLLLSLIAFCLVLKYCRDYSLAFYSPAFSFLSVYVCSKVNIANRLFDYIGRNSLMFYLFHIAILHHICLISHNEWVLLERILIITFALVFLYKTIENRLKNEVSTL